MDTEPDLFYGTREEHGMLLQQVSYSHMCEICYPKIQQDLDVNRSR